MATLVALAISYALIRKLPIMPMVSGIVVVVFGGLTLFLQDEIFIKLKPTIVNTLFGLVLLGGLYFRKPLLQIVLDSVFELTDEGWRKLTLRWALFFFALAALNEIVWRTQTTDFWVSFKVFGIMPLTIAFALAQTPLLLRYEVEQEGSAEAPPPTSLGTGLIRPHQHDLARDARQRLGTRPRVQQLRPRPAAIDRFLRGQEARSRPPSSPARCGTAMLTVSPSTVNSSRLSSPTTPQNTSPVWMPMPIRTGGSKPRLAFQRSMRVEQRAAAGERARGIAVLRRRHAEQDERPVAGELVDDAAMPGGRPQHPPAEGRDEDGELRRLHGLAEGGRGADVDEEQASPGCAVPGARTRRPDR